MNTDTVFCTDEDTRSDSTIWIASVEAVDIDAAATAGRRACANDWATSQAAVKVLGVAEGSVNILNWCDDGIELPAPEVLAGFKVEVNAFPGCDFNGAWVFEVTLDEPMPEALEEFLDDIDVGDDALGEFSSQVTKAMAAMVEQNEDGEICRTKSLVLACGRRASEGDNDSPMLETFDVTIDVVPVYEVSEDEED